MKYSKPCLALHLATAFNLCVSSHSIILFHWNAMWSTLWNSVPVEICEKCFCKKWIAKILGSLIWCVCVWAHIHTNAHIYSMKRDWIKNTLRWNIQTFFLDDLHVPYTGDSGLQISNLFYFPSRTSQCDSKHFHKNTRTVCVTIDSISIICCNVFCTYLVLLAVWISAVRDVQQFAWSCKTGALYMQCQMSLYKLIK